MAEEQTPFPSKGVVEVPVVHRVQVEGNKLVNIMVKLVFIDGKYAHTSTDYAGERFDVPTGFS